MLRHRLSISAALAFAGAASAQTIPWNVDGAGTGDLFGVALDGGADGLDVARRVAAGAAGWLAQGGHLVVETSERQADRLAAAVAAGGLRARVVHDDDLDATAVVGGPRG